MENDWLKNLARAELVDGRWRLDNGDAIRERAVTELLDVMPRLFDEAAKYAEIFNFHSRGRTMKVLPIQSPTQELTGFTLLLGSAQLKVGQNVHDLEVTLTEMRGFRRVEKTLYVLRPIVDDFGCLFWFIERNGPFNDDIILKNLFRDICEAACQSS